MGNTLDRAKTSQLAKIRATQTKVGAGAQHPTCSALFQRPERRPAEQRGGLAPTVNTAVCMRHKIMTYLVA